MEHFYLIDVIFKYLTAISSIKLFNLFNSLFFINYKYIYYIIQRVFSVINFYILNHSLVQNKTEKYKTLLLSSQ